MNKKSLLLSVGLASCLTVSSTQVLASAFQSFEQNSSGLGNAYSGMATNDNDDASTEFSNPAAMVTLKKGETDFSTVLVDSHTTFRGKTATNLKSQSITGKKNVHPLGVNPLPAFHYVQPITGRLFAGFGITVPFGLETDYPKDSIARYFATKSKIMAINIGPVIAYKITPTFSVGAGVGAEYLSADLDQQVDASSLLNLGNSDPSNDVTMDNHASGWGWSGVFGLFYRPTETTRVGLSYHLPVFLRPTGTSKVSSGLSQAQMNTLKDQYGIEDTRISTHMVLPEMLVFSATQALTNRLTGNATISWTRWSRFRDLRLKFHSKMATATVHEDFKNTLRYALGFNYQATQAIKLRMGAAIDLSPTDNRRRNVRLPDAHRVWWSVGGAYNFTKNLQLNLGYSFVYIGNGTVSQSETNTLGTMSVSGKFERAYANLFGAQLNWLFG